MEMRSSLERSLAVDLRVRNSFRVDEVERLAETYRTAPISYIQARPGALGARIKEVSTPRVGVREASFKADVLLCVDTPRPRRFGVGVRVAGEVRLFGTDLTSSNLGYVGGQNGSVVRLRDGAWCNLAIDWELLHTVAATHHYAIPTGDRSHGMPTRAHQLLVATLSGIAGGGRFFELSNEQLEDELALTVLRVLNPCEAPERVARTRHLSIVRRVIDFIQSEYSSRVTMTGLCRLVGVSERSLQYIFRDATGYSVQQYLMNYRLHRARSVLSRGEAEQTVDVAKACGIPHAGRFAQYYKRMFGESPQQTLVRQTASLESPRTSPAR